MVSEGHGIEFEGTALVVIADQIVVTVWPLRLRDKSFPFEVVVNGPTVVQQGF